MFIRILRLFSWSAITIFFLITVIQDISNAYNTFSEIEAEIDILSWIFIIMFSLLKTLISLSIIFSLFILVPLSLALKSAGIEVSQTKFPLISVNTLADNENEMIYKLNQEIYDSLTEEQKKNINEDVLGKILIAVIFNIFFGLPVTAELRSYRVSSQNPERIEWINNILSW